MSNCNIVLEKPQIDSSIMRKEIHSYSSYLQSFQNNNEIRITIQNQDLYALPSESLLYIEGFVTKDDSTVSLSMKLQNNCVAHVFDEIRYEINGIEIDCTRYLGYSSFCIPLKCYLDLQKILIKLLLMPNMLAKYYKFIHIES